MEPEIRSRDPAAIDAWLLAQWSCVSSDVSREEGRAPEVRSDAGPVYPSSKLYAVADYIMRDSNGRISKKNAMETLEMIHQYQEHASQGE